MSGNGPPPSGLTTANAPPLSPPAAPLSIIDPRLLPYEADLALLFEKIKAQKATRAATLTEFMAALHYPTVYDDLLALIPDASKHFLAAVFLKLYNCQAYLASRDQWPLPTLPELPLASIEGIHDETVLDSFIRVMRSLATAAGISSLEKLFVTLTRLVQDETKEAADILAEITRRPAPAAIALFRAIQEKGRVVNNTVLFDAESNETRFMGYFSRAASYEDLLLDLTYNSYYGELSAISFLTRYNPAFRLTKEDSADQQYVAILPESRSIQDLTNAIANIGLVSRNDSVEEIAPAWIQLAAPIGQRRRPLSGVEFYAVQGYRCRKWPNPLLLVALAQSPTPPQMSPHAATLFPEWGTRDGVIAWLTGVLKEWKDDIRSMYGGGGDQQDVQMRLYNYVVEQVRASPSAAAVAGEPLPANRATAVGATYAQIAQPAPAEALKDRRGRLAANVAALAAAANTLDPNVLYQRTKNLGEKYSAELAANLAPGERILFQSLAPRRRGWFTGESKNSYRRTVKSRISRLQKLYGEPTLPIANTARADALTEILNQGRDARAAWTAFKAWREAEPRLFDGSMEPGLVAEIAAVGPKGFFASTSAYVRRLRNLQRRFQGLPPVVGGGGGGRRTAKAKTSAFSRKMRRGRGRRQTHRGSRRQRGGATPMPLAYYQQGAQMLGTSADPTGAGLAATNSTWARAPLPRGGGRRHRRTQRRVSQHGGWAAPSVMGAFVANGSRLLPVAAYMGYRQSQGKRGKI